MEGYAQNAQCQGLLGGLGLGGLGGPGFRVGLGSRVGFGSLVGFGSRVGCPGGWLVGGLEGGFVETFVGELPPPGVGETPIDRVAVGVVEGVPAPAAAVGVSRGLTGNRGISAMR